MKSSLQGRECDSVPGPQPTPFLGSKGNAIRFFRDPIAYLNHLHSRYGEIAAMVRGQPGIVFAFGPKYNQQILGHPEIFHSTSLLLSGPPGSAQRRLNDSLFSMNGDQAMQRRKVLAPPFHKKAVESYCETVAAITDTRLQSWRVKPFVDIASEMKRLTLHLAGEVLFGTGDAASYERLGFMIERWVRKTTSPAVRLVPRNGIGYPYRRLLSYAEQVEKAVLALVDQRRSMGATGCDVLGILLQARDDAGHGMTESELVGQTANLILASYETLSNALTWTLFLLAQHPKVAMNLVDEITATGLGKGFGSRPFMELPLLDRVIKESLRVLPPVIYYTKTSAQPFQLGPYPLPAQTTVGFSHYITHHMAEIYPEPERFIPDRWSGPEPSHFHYMPFGAGPRTCMGVHFATMC